MADSPTSSFGAIPHPASRAVSQTASLPEVVLLEFPNWRASATMLVRALGGLRDRPEAQLDVMERFCRELGNALYPGFLKVLCTVEHYGDLASQQLVAQTLAHAISTGRIPTGQMPAWGSAGLASMGWLGTANLPPSALGNAAVGMAPSAGRVSRSLGPIEFLCAWAAQPSAMETLTNEQFETVLGKLLTLVNSAEQARKLYINKLQDDLNNSLEGSYSRQTRALLESLFLRWQAGATVEQVVAAASGAAKLHDRFGLPGAMPSTAR